MVCAMAWKNETGEAKKKRNSLFWLQQDINDRDETNQAWVAMASQPIHSNQCDCIELSASQSPIRQAKHTPVIHFPQFSRGVTSNVCVTCASIILWASDGGYADSREPFQTVITHTAHSVCNWTVTEFLFFWLGARAHWIWNGTMLTLKLTFSTLTTQVLFHFKSNVQEYRGEKNIKFCHCLITYKLKCVSEMSLPSLVVVTVLNTWQSGKCRFHFC